MFCFQVRCLPLSSSVRETIGQSMLQARVKVNISNMVLLSVHNLVRNTVVLLQNNTGSSGLFAFKLSSSVYGISAALGMNQYFLREDGNDFFVNCLTPALSLFPNG